MLYTNDDIRKLVRDKLDVEDPIRTVLWIIHEFEPSFDQTRRIFPLDVLAEIVEKCFVYTYKAQHKTQLEEAKRIDEFLYEQYMLHIENIETDLVLDDLMDLVDSLRIYYATYNPNLPKYSAIISSMVMLRKLYSPEIRNIPVKLKGAENATDFVLAFEDGKLRGNDRFAKEFFRISDRLLTAYDVTKPYVILDPQSIKSDTGWLHFIDAIEANPHAMDFLADHLLKACEAVGNNADLSKYPRRLLETHDLTAQGLVKFNHWTTQAFQWLVDTAEPHTFEVIAERIAQKFYEMKEYGYSDDQISDSITKNIAFRLNENLERVCKIADDPNSGTEQVARRIYREEIDCERLVSRYSSEAYRDRLARRIEDIFKYLDIDPALHMVHLGGKPDNFDMSL